MFRHLRSKAGKAEKQKKQRRRIAKEQKSKDAGKQKSKQKSQNGKELIPKTNNPPPEIDGPFLTTSFCQKADHRSKQNP